MICESVIFIYFCAPSGDVAQLVEQRTENPCVGGSIPSVTTAKAAPLRLFLLMTNTSRSFLLICLFLLGARLGVSESIENHHIDSAVIRLDTLPDQKSVRAFRVFAAPIALGISSALTWRDEGLFSRGAIQEWRMNSYPDFKTQIDNYIQYAPAVAVYALDAFGLKAKNKILKQTILLAGSQALMSTVVYPLKSISNVERPNGTGFRSFPSGHTATAFVAATFMHKEFGHLSKWYSIGAFSIAATTGALRILNNEHWLPDVLAGAAFGILAVNTTYWLGALTEKKLKKVSMTPVYLGGPGLLFSAKF